GRATELDQRVGDGVLACGRGVGVRVDVLAAVGRVRSARFLAGELGLGDLLQRAGGAGGGAVGQTEPGQGADVAHVLARVRLGRAAPVWSSSSWGWWARSVRMVPARGLPTPSWWISWMVGTRPG